MKANDRSRLFESLRKLIIEDSSGRLEERTADNTEGSDGDPWEGRRVGRYLLAEKIGEGASSKVYWALHVDLQKPLAVKLLKTSLAAASSGMQWRGLGDVPQGSPDGGEPGPRGHHCRARCGTYRQRPLYRHGLRRGPDTRPLGGGRGARGSR